MNQSWRGIFPSLPTPFDADGGLDLDGQRRVVDFAVESGAHGLLCFGLAGEVFRLLPDERMVLLEAIVEQNDGRVPVLAGVGTEAVHSSVAVAQRAEAIGADAVVVPPPVTAGASRRELLHYFEAVAGSVSLPVMVQDAPEHLNVEVGPELVEQLCERAENVRFVKLEFGADRLGDWVDALEDRVRVFGGNGGLYLLESLDQGIAGVAPGVDLVDILVEVHDFWADGRQGSALERFLPLLPALLFELQDITHYNACAKYVLARRGLLENVAMRAPGAELTDRGRRLLDAHLDRLGILARESAR